MLWSPRSNIFTMKLQYDAFTRAANFTTFALMGRDTVSLELIHNNIHNDAACGQQFSTPDLSAFDPLLSVTVPSVGILRKLTTCHPVCYTIVTWIGCGPIGKLSGRSRTYFMIHTQGSHALQHQKGLLSRLNLLCSHSLRVIVYLTRPSPCDP